MISARTARMSQEEAARQIVNRSYERTPEDELRRVERLLPMLRLPRPNVLVVGEGPHADRMFERLRPYVRTPILSWVPRQVPEPPTSAGTLVIRGVETLTAAQQQRVLALNGRTLRDIQIVSIAGSPLYPFVRRGLFLDRLYYQLNVVFFDLSGSI